MRKRADAYDYGRWRGVAIGSAARKVLWGRSANLCAYRGCSQQLTVNLHSEESELLEAAGIPLGEEAHIVSGSADGPRHDSTYPQDRIDSYENLILLCPNHHSLIDKKRGDGFSAETLRRMKQDHEAAMLSMKSEQTRRKEELEVRTLLMIELWAVKAQLDEWESLTWRLNVPVPRLKLEEIDRLTRQAEWLTTRNWPRDFPQVRRAFDNYRAVLRDVINHTRTTMEPIEGREEVWEIYREHKHRYLSQAEYNSSLMDFRRNAAILGRLSRELTKAANLACDAARNEVDPFFRFDEGILPHRVGDGVFVNEFTREEYSPEEVAKSSPYPGLAWLVQQVDEQLRMC
jgi:hypothetical protein